MSVLLSLNHNGIPREGHMKPTLMQINSLWVAALWLLSGVMGHHFKSVSVATFNEKCCVKNMPQHFSPCVFIGWKCVLYKRQKLHSLFFSQFKDVNCVWRKPSNFSKNQSSNAYHQHQVQLQLFVFLVQMEAWSRKTMSVTFPRRPVDKTFLKQFFFFLEDFGLRQCCKSILLSPNVSRWRCMEAVKVNDRSLTHSWWFQVEEKKKKINEGK